MKATEIVFKKFANSVANLWEQSPVVTAILIPIAICFCLGYIVAWQFAIIWGLNTLFNLGIAYNTVNCLAVYVLTTPVRRVYEKLSQILIILEQD